MIFIFYLKQKVSQLTHDYHMLHCMWRNFVLLMHRFTIVNKKLVKGTN